MPGSLMIYGATGYTGRRIAEAAVARGLRPVLAGRNADTLRGPAQLLGCEARAFSLGAAADTAPQLAGVRAVLHCAGPFSATGVPMMEACLAARVHYLDITGEIDVIEAAASRHARAAEAGIAIIPAVGFDVVPSDCLAAMLAARLPSAAILQLAFGGLTRMSPGTAKTVIEALGAGGRIRQGGKIVSVPLAWKSIEVPFRSGRQTAVGLPWGDIASAWHSTGIPNIEVFAAAPAWQVTALRGLRAIQPLLNVPQVGASLGFLLCKVLPVGAPIEEGEGRASFWGRVGDAHGGEVEATLETPGGYTLTVQTALASAERVLAGGVAAGFHTPSKAFGAEFILSIPGCDVQFT